MTLNLDEQSARRLLANLDWTELEQEGLSSALFGTGGIPTEGTFTVVSSTSGQDVETYDEWPKLVASLGNLFATDFFHVRFEGKKVGGVVIFKARGQTWRLFVNQLARAQQSGAISSGLA
jgi:hypothetical protein